MLCVCVHVGLSTKHTCGSQSQLAGVSSLSPCTVCSRDRTPVLRLAKPALRPLKYLNIYWLAVNLYLFFFLVTLVTLQGGME